MGNGDAPICGQHTEAIKRNSEAIRDLVKQNRAFQEKVDEYIDSDIAWKATIKRDYKLAGIFLSTCTGLFVLIGGGLVLFQLKTFIWG